MRSLSQARRLMLIKLVTSAIPVYSMAQFLLPKAISDRLDGMRKRFLWGYRDDGQRHMFFKSWDSISQPKACGGLEIKRMWDLNRA